MITLTLNDLDCRLSIDGETVHNEPAIAFTNGREIDFGESALSRSRIRPASTFSYFVQHLNQQPIKSDAPGISTQADLLYQFLIRFKERLPGGNTEAWYVVVSSDVGTAQLGVLLGVMQAASIPVKNFVDEGLFVNPTTDHIAHIEFRMHRSVVSIVDVDQDEIEVANFIGIEKAGFDAFTNRWIEYVAQRFLSSNRFDPRSFGTTEQQLFDQLLEGILEGKEYLTVRTDYRDETREVQIASKELAVATMELVNSIVQPIDRSRTVSLDNYSKHIPGLVETLLDRGYSILQEPNSMSHAAQMIEQNSTDRVDWIRRATRIETSRQESEVESTTTQVSFPTHILSNGIASPLPMGHASLPLAFKTDEDDPKQTVLLLSNDAPALINQRRVTGGTHEIRLGDVVRVDDTEFQAIYVIE